MAEADRAPNDRSPFWVRHRWLLAAGVVVLVVAAMFTVICDSEPSVETSHWSYEPDRDVLLIGVPDCGGTYASGAIETDESVSVWIYAIRPVHGPFRCGEFVQIQLQEPIGDRRVVNGRTGDPIPPST